ncbi:MAG: hypothetical protein A3B96_01140 [Candidatus Spechtbacteria bacterium RIFCSPHIGHO2_02_FULL_43_15b]|uniref:Bacterial sugar transferase domain-containing protein n=1 Tax=Candidatus Spechtbacteria bacterium RIFCSPHIGHO2_01_FULL_43_30 TaxID=1802158 RepID=A0A1G2H4C2_9BACT|nr:MAG: hypothetical protein A2827_03540 [Candidatus Spechtbacteria bacterium RIFCSPHIGHO2_01_FULL_43_30]OGZ59019.1 MAG: hypothetical protein A3B96_01140 [Candidatus Spechtbacteria bacterium RIFCSPHIGHO2_02_FULL_43_15b]
MANILKIKQLILLGGDTILMISSLPAMLFISFQQTLTQEIFAAHFFPFLGIYALLIIVFYINGLYEIRSFAPSSSVIAKLVISHTLGFVFGIVIFYFSSDPQITPKINLALNIAISFSLVSAWRIVFQRFIAQHLKTNVAIAGMNEHAKELARIIKARPYIGYRLKAVIKTDELLGSDLPEDESEYANILRIDKNLAQNLINLDIQTVITSENPHANPLITKAFYECMPYGIEFLDLAQSYEILTGRIPISYITQAWFLENINEHQKRLYTNFKRVIDLVVAIVVLIVTSPVWPVIAFFIKFDTKGSVFYTQERVGINKKVFRLIKFRSMVRDAEKNKAVWAQKNDPRITRIGKFLRRTHIDELPQMINIARGEISLVGPRPERIEFVKELESQIPHYNVRHIITPGFTGWAQVNFRYARTPEDTYEKFQYDLYYLKNRSIILDIAIILKTISLLFRGEKNGK